MGAIPNDVDSLTIRSRGETAKGNTAKTIVILGKLCTDPSLSPLISDATDSTMQGVYTSLKESNKVTKQANERQKLTLLKEKRS